MKKLTCLIVLISIIVSVSCENIPSYLLANNDSTSVMKKTRLNVQESAEKGKKDASSEFRGTSYLILGIGSGFLLPVIGPTTFILLEKGTHTYTIPANVDSLTYSKSYFKENRSLKKKTIFIGGVIGTTVMIAYVAHIINHMFDGLEDFDLQPISKGK